MNVVVLIGTLSHEPNIRELPSGEVILTFDLTTRPSEGRAESVPVVCPGPSATVAALEAGDDVVVTGRVRRRFFRVGASTQSRTEVVADQVVRGRQRKRRSAVLERAAAVIVA